MMRPTSVFRRLVSVAVFGALCLATEAGFAGSRTVESIEIEPGLEWIRLPVPATGGYSADVAQIVRLDPARWRLRLLNASVPGEGEPRTAKEWCMAKGLSAVINASMYQEDHRTSVSLMKTGSHTNNGRLSKDRTILGFDRQDPDVPEVQIIDRDCQDFDSLRRRYGTMVQSIRMVSCDGRNVWSKETRRTSLACLAVDRDGRVLLIHVRTPQNPHDFIELLLAAPLRIRNAMYLEGGSESQLFVRAADREMEFVGQPDLGLITPNAAPTAWRIPNVLGVARRSDRK